MCLKSVKECSSFFVCIPHFLLAISFHCESRNLSHIHKHFEGWKKILTSVHSVVLESVLTITIISTLGLSFHGFLDSSTPFQ